MYDWANSVYSLTITSRLFSHLLRSDHHNEHSIVERNFVLERYGVPSASSLYSYALSAGFLLVALVVPLLSGIADHRGNKLNYLKLFCYVGAASCAGLFFFSAWRTSG